MVHQQATKLTVLSLIPTLGVFYFIFVELRAGANITSREMTREMIFVNSEELTTHWCNNTKFKFHKCFMI